MKPILAISLGFGVVAALFRDGCSHEQDIREIQENQIQQAKVIANKLNSLEREIKEMKKAMETKPILPEVRL